MKSYTISSKPINTQAIASSQKAHMKSSQHYSGFATPGNSDSINFSFIKIHIVFYTVLEENLCNYYNIYFNNMIGEFFNILSHTTKDVFFLCKIIAIAIIYTFFAEK